MANLKPDTELDTRPVVLGAAVGVASMLATSVLMGGLRSRFSVIALVMVAGVTVGVPAGSVTGVLSTAAETEMQHGGFAGVVGTLAGIVAVGSVESAMAPLPTIAHKLDVLYLTMTYGFGTFVFFFPFIFIVSAYVSRYAANVRWKLNNGDTEWGDKGRYREDRD